MGHNIKDTLKERMDLIMEEANNEVKSIKRTLNRNICDEVESTLNDIENNYQMGMLTIHESFEQKIELLTSRSLQLYPQHETE